MGVWYFVSEFLNAGAQATVSEYGGSYVAYVMTGVLFNQIGMAALIGPITTVSDTFWDNVWKRIACRFRASGRTSWAGLPGRFCSRPFFRSSCWP